MESCTFLGVNFQTRWALVSKIWKPLKNHWKQWSGGWKSLNGDGWMTPKPLKNHRVQWSVIKKVVNGDCQKGSKTIEEPLMPMVLAGKNHRIPSLPKNDHCSPLRRFIWWWRHANHFLHYIICLSSKFFLSRWFMKYLSHKSKSWIFIVSSKQNIPQSTKYTRE